MNRSLTWGVGGAAVLLALGFGGYYFAVAVPARDRAALALQQQQVAAQKARVQAEQAAAQAKQSALDAVQARQQQEQADKEKRSSYLAACQQAAENEYTNYVRLNGAAVDGQPGVYRAPQMVWDSARQRKQDKLDECFRLVDSGVNPDDLGATVTPTTLPDPAPVTAGTSVSGGDTVPSLVNSYLSAGEGSDPASALSLYADEVNYFERGEQPRSAILLDKQNYFRRWPVRTYTLDSDIRTVYDTGDTRQIRFDYTYRVIRADKTLSGRAYTVLDLKRTDGGLGYVITGERGKVY